MRRIAYVFGGLAAAGAGTYLVIYLYRWQWQRAMICGVLLLVVEVMLFGLVVLARLSRIEERLRDSDRRQRETAARQDDALARLRAAPGPEPAASGTREGRFRWLDEPAERTYVFVPVLMVAGVALSGIAWVVQKVAAATARPAERRLAGRLAVLTAPDPAAPGDLEDLPPVGAPPSPGRTARLAAVGVVGAALLAALVVGLADLTQTREEEADESAATSVVVQVDLRDKSMDEARRSLAARQVWERCRDSTSVPLNHAALGDLGDGLYAGVVRPALTDHDRLRLRGCLEDATLERVSLTVVGIGDAETDEE
ncbi:hypothetical protein Stsp02_36370 [Streptomyces sp. NBRC 14336]|uniref:hypothetical protein n=1 Tax=Streptomyces sp. NBRC 14336 TaxID=3030992 RepID=UPI0024A326BC|nr:hypothetical protein [Streptomyces sp. NBRC 14336]WBO77323.1 hypothetical protein SBE_000837 [Streptomyces sp. SBE_14.2]GLW47975.1 hypothetical protein Stsp02_36370 [Streptomyces sp. NBRC 14336]